MPLKLALQPDLTSGVCRPAGGPLRHVVRGGGAQQQDQGEHEAQGGHVAGMSFGRVGD